MQKKGSLNLSINAIVVLILAITMLGLGLGFMKTMFGKATEQFEDVAGEMKTRIIEEIQSSDERITLNVVEMDLKKGGSKDVFFGIKNEMGEEGLIRITKGTGADDVGAFSESGQPGAVEGIICYTNFAGDAPDAIMGGSPQIKFSTVKTRSLDAGDVAVLKMTASATSAAQSSTYSCGIAITFEDSTGSVIPYATKYFNINVK